jgi:hypothetical protein
MLSFWLKEHKILVPDCFHDQLKAWNCLSRPLHGMYLCPQTGIQTDHKVKDLYMCIELHYLIPSGKALKWCNRWMNIKIIV